MTSNILSRCFRRWWTSVPSREITTVTAPLPPQPKAYGQNQLTLADLTDQNDVNLLLLGCLAGQGSYSLSISDTRLAHDSQSLKDLLTYLNNLQGVVTVRQQYYARTLDLVVDFSTAEDAAMAFATHPSLDLGNGVRRNFEYEDLNTTALQQELELEPHRKRMKRVETEAPEALRCHICCEELTGSFVRPCLSCKITWCYGCIKTDFEGILTDLDRFPARCCGKIMHYDVARSIIKTDDHNKYKARFEEFSTTKPVYCANMRCSVFLPSRIAQSDEKGRLFCPDCMTLTCKECRSMVEETGEHKCTASNEAAALLAKFEYKSCPRCNTAVARMFGCSHMRCQCGAHFCWDCLRPIHMCWSKPCRQARADDGYIDDDDDDDDDDVDDEHVALLLALSRAARPVLEPAMDRVDAAPATQTASPESTDPQHLNASVEVSLADTQNLTDQIAIATATPEALLENTVIETPQEQTNTQPPAMQVEEPPILSNLFDAATHIVEPTHFETPADAPPHTPIVEPVVNLDGISHGDWEGGDWDFGDEPLDETWDTWGCLHSFQHISARDCKDWLPLITSTASGRAERHVDCMRCYKTIIFDNKTEVLREEELEKDTERTTQQSTDIPGTWPSDTVQPISDNSANSDPQKLKTKKKKRGSAARPKLYNCGRCGIFHCTECKTIVAAEISRQLES